IRDYKVTGVQTCALPIYFPQRELCRAPKNRPFRRQSWGLPTAKFAAKFRVSRHSSAQERQRTRIFRGKLWLGNFAAGVTRNHSRSEERRVGKECRTRMAA